MTSVERGLLAVLLSVAIIALVGVMGTQVVDLFAPSARPGTIVP